MGGKGGTWGKYGILIREMTAEQKREYHHDWYLNHPGYKTKQSEDRRKAWRTEMLEKLGGKCSLCGYSKSTWALEAHHLDPFLKTEDPSRFYKISEERRNKELKNCVLLCSNCHIEVHKGEGEAFNGITSQSPRRKVVQARIEEVRIIGGSECQICGYRKNPAALHFHHMFPETKTIGIIDGCGNRKFEVVCKEVMKCILLCANCHRELHAGLIPTERLLTIGQIYEIFGNLESLWN
jgi:hypothetical protein